MHVLKQLLKTSGKVIFIIGFVLSVLMVFSGFWPSFLLILLMLAGLALVLLINERSEFSPGINFKEIEQSFKNASIKINFIYLKNILRKAIIGLSIAFAALVILFILYIPYRNKNKTISKGKEIIQAIEAYKQQTGSYPENIYEVIGNNPLRKDWKVDGWNNDYIYENKIDSIVLLSKGKDGVIKTEDDIRSTSGNKNQ